MGLTIETFNQTFTTRVAGVTFDNPDGINRQYILSRARQGQAVRLVREYDNPHSKDGTTIAVQLMSGEQIGYIPSGDVRLARHIDQGGGIEAMILKVTGGPGILGRVIPAFAKYYGCVLKITKLDPDWKRVTPWRDADRAASELIEKAKRLEKTKPIKSLELYAQAMSAIQNLDALGRQAAAWRTTRYPINRFSLLLERSGQIDDAVRAIEIYETLPDEAGISASDASAIQKRKERLRPLRVA